MSKTPAPNKPSEAQILASGCLKILTAITLFFIFGLVSYCGDLIAPNVRRALKGTETMRNLPEQAPQTLSETIPFPTFEGVQFHDPRKRYTRSLTGADGTRFDCVNNLKNYTFRCDAVLASRHRMIFNWSLIPDGLFRYEATLPNGEVVGTCQQLQSAEFHCDY